MKKLKFFKYLALTLIMLSSSCYVMHKSSGGGQVSEPAKRIIKPEDIALPDGYRIEAVAQNLTFPTGIAFDETGAPYITESGYAYGEVFTVPKLLKINPDGTTRTICMAKITVHGTGYGIMRAIFTFLKADRWKAAKY